MLSSFQRTETAAMHSQFLSRMSPRTEEKSTPSPKNNLVCPLCQKESALPEGGLDTLSTNYGLVSLLDEVAKQEQLLGDEGAKIVCQACEEDNAAISQCLDCEHYLCQECEKAHKRLVNMRAHKITAMTEIKGNVVSNEDSSENILMCGIHKNNKLCFYCNFCEHLICKQCTVAQHNGSSHYVVDLCTAIHLNFEGAREYISQARKCDAFKDTASSINWATLRTRLSLMLAETKRLISKRVTRYIAKLKQKEQQLLQQADLNFRSKDRKLAELILAERTVKTVHGNSTDNDRIKLLTLRQELLREYKGEAREPMTHDDDISFISFKESENEVELGTILLKEKWEIKEESKFVGGMLIASFSTGDVVVLSRPRKLIRFSSIGKELVNIGEFEDAGVINQPTAIAVNKNDELIVLDRIEVKIFSQEYHLLHKFTVGGQLMGYPTCLAVDDKSNVIAVGYDGTDNISLHNPDGSLLKKITSPWIARYITISKQQCYYTNSRNRAFVCVDFQGNIIFKIKTPFVCFGMCSDKSSNIYLMATLSNHKHGQYVIKRCNTDGKFHDCLTTDCTEITYTSDGTIVAAGNESLKVVHRVIERRKPVDLF